MKYELPGGMREAIRLTKAGRLTEATAALQYLLGGRGLSGRAAVADGDGPPTIDGVAEPVETPVSARLPHPIPHAGDSNPPRKAARSSVEPFRFKAFQDSNGVAPISPASWGSGSNGTESSIRQKPKAGGFSRR
jgi:hypothetical protein